MSPLSRKLLLALALSVGTSAAIAATDASTTQYVYRTSSKGVRAPVAPPVEVPPVEQPITPPHSTTVVFGSRTFVLPSLGTPSLTTAHEICAAEINGTTGWRVPQLDDVEGLVAGVGTATLAAKGWPSSSIDWYWTAGHYSGSRWYVLRLSDGGASVCTNDVGCARAMCVK